MRFYTQPHRFYAGGDRHARTLYLHVLDADGRTCCDQTLPARPDAFLAAIAPFRDGLVVGVECMFAWYWLADLCADQGIPFVLGHALYMKAIHGGKTKTDKIDAGKIAGLLRGGLFPQAYVYPKALRETRDLLRRRTFLVRQRAQLDHLGDLGQVGRGRLHEHGVRARLGGETDLVLGRGLAGVAAGVEAVEQVGHVGRRRLLEREGGGPGRPGDRHVELLDLGDDVLHPGLGRPDEDGVEPRHRQEQDVAHRGGRRRRLAEPAGRGPRRGAEDVDALAELQP